MNSLIYKPGFYGWKNAILLFFVYMFSSGLVFYGFSVIFPEMINSLKWDRAAASVAHTFCVLLMGITLPLVAVSINKLGIRKTINIGLLILLFSLILLGTIAIKLWQWITLWGIAGAIGFAFCGLLPIQTSLLHWFHISRAKSMGIVMTGAAAGGFIAQPFYARLMEMTGTWQAGWLAGAFFAFMALICSFFLIDKPEDVCQFPDGIIPNKYGLIQKSNMKIARTYRASSPWELKEVFKTPTIWFFAIVIIGHLMPLFLVTSHGILSLTDRGFSQMQAAGILSFILLGSGLARFPAGWLGDQFEPRWILTITLGIMLFMFIGIWKLSSFKILLAAGTVFGFCYGSQIVMFPTLLGNYYGPEAFAGINGILAPFLIIFAAIVPIGAGIIFEKSGTYDLAFLLLCVILTVGFSVSFLLAPPIKR